MQNIFLCLLTKNLQSGIINLPRAEGSFFVRSYFGHDVSHSPSQREVQYMADNKLAKIIKEVPIKRE